MQHSFFKEMAMIGPGFQLTMTVKEKNGKLTISLIPDGIEDIKALILTGTPEELEEVFWEKARKPLQDAHGVVVHNEEYAKSLEAAKKVEKPAATKSNPPKGTPAKAAVTKSTKSKEEGEEEDDDEPAPIVQPKKQTPVKNPKQKAEPTGPEPVQLF